MITYFYWTVVFITTGGIFYLFFKQAKNIKLALISSAIVFLAGTSLYYFYLEQVFVKRWGGVMHISIPEGQRHIATTWKEDNLWVENYDPKTNTCYFNEYSRGNLLEGRVVLKNCNPLRR